MQKSHWLKKLAVTAIVVAKISFMDIEKGTNERRGEIIRLLQSQKLPSEDLPPMLCDFYTAIEDGKAIGLIGMERYAHYGLLRSMVVHPDYRNRHIAQALVRKLEETAALSGIRLMFLLTETAEKYFEKEGYDVITRDEVPDEVKTATEFSHVCPVSAIVMRKHLSTIRSKL